MVRSDGRMDRPCAGGRALPAPRARGARPGHRQWLRACRADTQQKERGKMIPRVGPVYTDGFWGLHARGTGDFWGLRARGTRDFWGLPGTWHVEFCFIFQGMGACVCGRPRELPAEARADSVRSGVCFHQHMRVRPAPLFPDCCRVSTRSGSCLCQHPVPPLAWHT